MQNYKRKIILIHNFFPPNISFSFDLKQRHNVERVKDKGKVAKLRARSFVQLQAEMKQLKSVVAAARGGT